MDPNASIGALTGSTPAPSPMGVAGGPMPTPNPAPVPAEAMTPGMAPPDVSPGINPATPPTPPPAGPSKAGTWANILQGALWGLAGAAGQRHFGGGLGAGAKGVLDQEQLQKENAVQQQQLQFESVKAADSHITALKTAQAADDAHEEHQQQIAEQSLILSQTMKALGIEPSVTVEGTTPSEITSSAKGALGTLAQRNGGTIPSVATTNIPAGASSDGKHQVQIYTTNAGDIQKNPNGNRSLVDEVSRIQTGSPVPDQAWTSGGGAMLGKIPNPVGGQVAMVQDAKKFLLPQLPTKDASENDAIAAGNHQQLDAYKASIGDTPTPQQAAVLKALEAKTDTFDSSVKNLTKKTAADQAAAAGQKKTAENAAPLNPLEAQEKEAQIKKANSDIAANEANLGLWKPKVGADEKKKAELAENISENAANVKAILTRRPDLIGKLAGRVTNVQQLIGNNDPDISALGNRIHNIAMANSGVHGFRSQEGVKETENNILNNFHNGPQAVLGALKSNVDSVQTFIDDARPNNYQTHSEQGGAGAFYEKKVGVGGHQVGDTKTFPNGNVGTWDGNGWVKK